ncbi:MAG: 2,3-bisphosphoglycerate-dependent phosphoglycerate mutase [Alphaproteobacteria bacterium MarineAlpha5_Bin2]|jgi:2,3-bisphosphoglycerate-dependent phosphoglycerate mutase|nr:MAG: 2,3-bisphosphoglycerate-dependent phosphoglycerate mutase [Alphaproteobacteria bacterium MarineAlpha5_Bin2]PPR57411.1 MAG: 2,3-bisphosphoglycerate-dependent phosphoglycerate mutase [Alphaproteobacteria bacterium MarineAlpha5_Bin3]HIC42382.1 2,3-bisphosphoglycerate-dependent phosphoglycerate mutase [Pelagibacterales bacterium]
MNNLILLRHGQSQWNLENRFTGWEDVPLTEQGIAEAKVAGQLMKKNKVHIDVIFSSVLQRATKTAELAIKEMNLEQFWSDGQLLMTKDQSLNERDYGDLVGFNKEETANKYGKEQVRIWRRSYDVSPPGGESLENVVTRVKPYFINFIEPKINEGQDVLIAAHGNSLRASMIQVGLYKAEEISKIEIPTGSPFIITYESGKVVNSKYLS